MWCDRVGVDCRFCTGTGWWRPEMPHPEADGVIGWIRVDEPCRMCAGTGRAHHPVSSQPA
ncbi:hypothetical protein GCM10027589_26270 [Actinocorallia lasiicapitis]